jgi:lipopolysaccharide/colanic/teichoic acid biosynthesis glycosyltransferase
MTISYPEFRSDAYSTAHPLPAAGHGGTDQHPRRRGLYRNLFKRALDVAAVTLALPVVAPLILGLALVVRRDGGPAFYSQLRVGKGGRHFRMWKLRSMVADADARFAAYLDANPEARREWDTTQKLKRDPRITAFGAFLRKSSLDELPQLFNVLAGDMSLVGPRPMMLNQQAMYPGQAYFALRPGITGHWQTAGRNATSFGARAAYDTAYDADLSLQTDLAILARTVGVVMRGTGY